MMASTMLLIIAVCVLAVQIVPQPANSLRAGHGIAQIQQDANRQFDNKLQEEEFNELKDCFSWAAIKHPGLLRDILSKNQEKQALAKDTLQVTRREGMHCIGVLGVEQTKTMDKTIELIVALRQQKSFKNELEKVLKHALKAKKKLKLMSSAQTKARDFFGKLPVNHETLTLEVTRESSERKLSPFDKLRRTIRS